MSWTERARIHRAQVDIAAAALNDATASMCVDLYSSMRYDGALIKNGTRINWNGALKRAAVDLWDTEQNNPDNAPVLWEDVAYYKGYRIIPEAITSTLAFSGGEIGYWPDDDSFYQAKNNGTTWPPSGPHGYPAAWEEIEIP